MGGDMDLVVKVAIRFVQHTDLDILVVSIPRIALLYISRLARVLLLEWDCRIGTPALGSTLRASPPEKFM